MILRGLMASGMPRLVAPLLRGRGIVFCGHRVLAAPPTFAPSRGLAATADFIDRLLGHLRRRGVDLIGLDAIPARLAAPAGAPFAHVSFDDGYADMLSDALPVFERHNAPFSVFVTTGFVERTHLMWWVVLEHAIANHDRIAIGDESWPTRTPAEKAAAYAVLEPRCRLDPQAADAIVAALVARHGEAIVAAAHARVLDWPGVMALARSPLVQIGCHAVSHAPLSRLAPEAAAAELAQSRRTLEQRLGRKVTTLAYPYGDSDSVDAGTVALAAAAGFTLALTTEGGMVQAADRNRLLAVPRTNLDGWHEDLAVIDFHLTGLAGVTRHRVAG